MFLFCVRLRSETRQNFETLVKYISSGVHIPIVGARCRGCLGDYPTDTGINAIVSLPKMSMTFTATT
jgi:hypothetical protein